MPKRHHAEVRGGTLRCRFTSPAAAGFPWRMHGSGRASRVLIDIDGSAELLPYQERRTTDPDEWCRGKAYLCVLRAIILRKAFNSSV